MLKNCFMTLLIAGFCLTVLNCSEDQLVFHPKSFDGTTKASSLPGYAYDDIWGPGRQIITVATG
jgi:hypothetical protein